MKNKIILTILMGICSFTLAAQQRYTLEQCRKLALENNIRVKNSRLEIKSAHQTQKEAFTNFFPKVSASGNWFNANKALLNMQLAPGMEISMLKNGLLGGVTATQPIFAGGQIVNGNKLAKLGVEVSGYQMEQSEKEVLLTTEQYYRQIISLQEKLKTIEIVEQLVNSLYKDVETAVKAGVNNRNDLLQVQLKRNSVTSNRLQVENGLSICKMLLGQYIGLEQDNFSIETTPFDELSSPEIYKTDHNSALIKTPEYQLLNKSVEASHLQKKIAAGKYMPTVGIGAGYMYDNLMDKDHPFGIVFTTISVPISDWWGGSHTIKKQNLQTTIAENNRKNSSDLLIIQMQKLWNDLTESYKQVKLAEESVITATENVRLNTDYYKAGTVTLSDLLDSQMLLQQSRDQYTDVYMQHLVKQTQYLQATGR
ncbi:TolC family protein [Bacteroides ihuae]|uniref:TolC family protein n=1 Tax=Bacteroides ihuae TaxID=1852362 RepID=UPI0008DA8DBE|nr:TolC family protein [Bacteroides ihuae]